MSKAPISALYFLLTGDLVRRLIADHDQAGAPKIVAAIGMDATPVETSKKAGLNGCKKFNAYQPVNLYRSDRGLMVFSEFRDRKAPADYDLSRSFKEALKLLPDGVNGVCFRSVDFS